MFKHIIVPVDFSQISREALPYAYSLAQRYDSRITLLHAMTLHEYDPHSRRVGFPAMDEIHEGMKTSAEAYFDGMIEEAKKEYKDLQIDKTLERGISVHSVITEYAKENNADLIVMATHGRSGLSNIVIGSVTDKVIQTAGCPVFVVKKPKHTDLQKLKFENILVPTDFSEHSQNAMEIAIDIARQYKSKITLMHVVDVRFNPAYYAVGVESIFDLDPDVKPRIQARLEAFLRSFDINKVKITTHISDGNSHYEIIKTAAAQKHDIIVMSTRGHDQIADYLIGSTTDRVIKRAPCPVFVCK